MVSSGNNMGHSTQPVRFSVRLGGDERERTRQERRFKLKLPTLFTCIIIIIVLIQILDSTEAKKIKIKDLKKVKKYAYLLAGQRKKLYAIPFPVPLPVFVKRQHIYTQVPVIPRYVQQPHSYYGGDAGDPYASMSSYSQQEVHPSYYHPMPAGSQQDGDTRPSSSQASKVSGKYLGQLASVISQTYPLQRDVISKILNGQAKIISPNQIRVSSLLSGLKQQSSKQQSNENSKPRETDNSANSNSTSKAESSSKGSSTNELYASATRHSRPVELMNGDYYRMPPGFVHAYSPYMMSPAHMAHMAPKMPMFHPQIVNELLQMVEPQLMEPSGQLDAQRPSQLEVQEPAASDSREYEVVAGDKVPNQDQLLAAAVQKARQQQALEASLARVKAEEARVAEINSLALHAHQLGLPLMPGQLRLLNY